MNIEIILLIAAIAFIDLAGRIAALISLMKDGKVKKLKYKTWVLLCMLLNFAWAVYFAVGRQKSDKC